LNCSEISDHGKGLARKISIFFVKGIFTIKRNDLPDKIQMMMPDLQLFPESKIRNFN